MRLIILSVVSFCLWPSTHSMTKSERDELRETVRDMFRHAYNSYMTYAYPADELMPLTCKGRYRGVEPSRGDVDDILGNFSMTLIDSLDSLAIFGDIKEFDHGVKLVIDNVQFESDIVVSVFETNIRVLGGLLGAHVAADVFKKAGTGMSWYDGELLDLARDIGERLLPAFNTTTGIPYPRVNLKYGISDPRSRTGTESDTCTACAGTMIMEFGALSRLTGNPVFEDVAHKAMKALWTYRSRTSDLVGTVINIHNGEWVRRDSGVGAGIDSYYEYCLKAYILLGEDDYLQRFNQHYKAVMRYINQGSLFLNVHMHNPSRLSYSFMDSLQAFWPGLQVLKGDLKAAIELHEVFYSVAKRHTFLPEAFTANFEVHWGQHLLRPELVESTYFLYEATKDPYYLEVGKYIVENLNKYTRVPCGFAAVKDVRTLSHEDRMDSFLLSETLKYLYLLFTEKVDLLIDIHDFIFTTEAHILPLALSNWNGTSNQNNLYQSEHLHDHSCPSTMRDGNIRSFAEEIRRKSRSKDPGKCPGRDKDKASSVANLNSAPPLRAEQFIPGNTEHLHILKSMGISVTKTDDGKVQLMQNAALADNSEMAAEGIKFMQSMIELAKFRSDDGVAEHLPRVVQIISSPYNGNIVLNAGPAQFGIDLSKSGMGVTAEVILAEPLKGCTSLSNQELVDHRIVMMERGECMFIDKVRQAQGAGAVGAIIVDNNKGSSSESQPMFAMSGDGSTDGINIPSVFLFSNEGEVLQKAMEIVTRNTGDYLRVRLADKASTQDSKTDQSPNMEGHLPRAPETDKGQQETSKSESPSVDQKGEERTMSADKERKTTSENAQKGFSRVNKLVNLMKNVVDQPGFEYLTAGIKMKSKASLGSKFKTKGDDKSWLYDMVVAKLKEEESKADLMFRQRAAEKADFGAIDKNKCEQGNRKGEACGHGFKASEDHKSTGNFECIERTKESTQGSEVCVIHKADEEKPVQNREVLKDVKTDEIATMSTTIEGPSNEARIVYGTGDTRLTDNEMESEGNKHIKGNVEHFQVTSGLIDEKLDTEDLSDFKKAHVTINIEDDSRMSTDQEMSRKIETPINIDEGGNEQSKPQSGLDEKLENVKASKAHDDTSNEPWEKEAIVSYANVEGDDPTGEEVSSEQGLPEL